MLTKDRQIVFGTNCLYQPNAVELTTGIVVFDACGKCADCVQNGLTGTVAKDGDRVRQATSDEIARQETAINAS